MAGRVRANRRSSAPRSRVGTPEEDRVDPRARSGRAAPVRAARVRALPAQQLPAALRDSDRPTARVPLGDTPEAPPVSAGPPLCPPMEPALVRGRRKHSLIRARCARHPPARRRSGSQAGICSCSWPYSPRLGWWARQPCGFPDYSASFERPIEGHRATLSFYQHGDLTTDILASPYRPATGQARRAHSPQPATRSLQWSFAMAARGDRLERVAAGGGSAVHVPWRDRRARWRGRNAQRVRGECSAARAAADRLTLALPARPL